MSLHPRDEIKQLEQAWMVLKDDYSELVRLICPEVKADGYFGDPLIEHKEVVERLKELVKKKKTTAGHTCKMEGNI